jgi:hypothetical protein
MIDGVWVDENKKSAIRELYEQSVCNAWVNYDDEVKRVMQSYQDAFTLGRIEQNDKTFQWRNTQFVKAGDTRDEALRTLWIKYQSTNDGGQELKAIILHVLKAAPGTWIPQTDDGRFMVKPIKTRNSHFGYMELEDIIKPTGLFYRKMHHGFLVLISDDDPLQRQLFTLAPSEAIK